MWTDKDIERWLHVIREMYAEGDIGFEQMEAAIDSALRGQPPALTGISPFPAPTMQAVAS